jgi:transcriptional regulator with XRE-family HTH domain
MAYGCRMSTATETRATAPRTPADDPVANRVRERRLALGWSLKRLSDAAGGLAPSFLYNIENGRKVPSEDVAVRIAHALEDAAHEETYRAWARAKSRGRRGRADHEALARAWELLRNPFGPAASAARAAMPATATPATAPPEASLPPSRDTSRLRVPVLAMASDPGDGVRPAPEQVINTLSLDPQMYGHDAALARERFVRLRRPFAFPLDEALAAQAGLPGSTLAVVTREHAGPIDPRATYVLRRNARLELVRGDALAAEAVPASLRARGFDSPDSLRAAVLGRIDLLLPDVRQ